MQIPNFSFIENLTGSEASDVCVIREHARREISTLVQTSQETGAPIVVMVGLPVTQKGDDLRCGKAKFSNNGPLECDGDLIEQGELSEIDKTNLTAAQELCEYLQQSGIPASLVVRLFDIRGIKKEQRSEAHERIQANPLGELPELSEHLSKIKNLFFVFGSKYSNHISDKYLNKIRKKLKNTEHPLTAIANFFRKTGALIIDAITLVECRPHLSTTGSRIPADEWGEDDVFLNPANMVRTEGGAVAISKSGGSTTCGMTSAGGSLVAVEKTKSELLSLDSGPAMTVYFAGVSEGFNAARGSMVATALSRKESHHLLFLSRQRQDDTIETSFCSNAEDLAAKKELLARVSASDSEKINSILNSEKKLREFFGGLSDEVERFIKLLETNSNELSTEEISNFRTLKKKLSEILLGRKISAEGAEEILNDRTSIESEFEQMPEEISYFISLNKKTLAELTDAELEELPDLRKKVVAKIMSHPDALEEINEPVIKMIKKLMETVVRPRLVEHLRAVVPEKINWAHQVALEGGPAVRVAKAMQQQFVGGEQRNNHGVIGDSCGEGETCTRPEPK